MLNSNPNPERGALTLMGWGLPAAIVALGGISLYSLVSLGHERSRSRELAASNQALSASLRQVQTQLQALADKPSPLETPPPPPVTAMVPVGAEAPVVPAAPPPEPVHRAVARPKPRPVTRQSTPRRNPDDERFRQLQADLADQQKQIADARQQADQNRQDLEAKLSSDHDELSGSIAKNHTELVALQKRGERNYFEFDLNKSKQFQRVGPLSLSLRRVNLKHKYFDLTLTVDDQQLEKKHVNLYEPLLFTVADRPQPIEVVVNQLKDNEAIGYVSDAKYKKSELNSASSAPQQAAPSQQPAPPAQQPAQPQQDSPKPLQRRSPNP